MRWDDDWPVIGDAKPGETSGQPVAQHRLPLFVPGAEDMDPATSDEFNHRVLGVNWEWNHNPDDSHWSLTERPGYLRLYAVPAPDLLHARNTLTEVMQDDSLEFTARFDLQHLADGGRAGISVFEKSANVRTVAAASRNGSASRAYGLRLVHLVKLSTTSKAAHDCTPPLV